MSQYLLVIFLLTYQGGLTNTNIDMQNKTACEAAVKNLAKFNNTNIKRIVYCLDRFSGDITQDTE